MHAPSYTEITDGFDWSNPWGFITGNITTTNGFTGAPDVYVMNNGLTSGYVHTEFDISIPASSQFAVGFLTQANDQAREIFHYSTSLAMHVDSSADLLIVPFVGVAKASVAAPGQEVPCDRRGMLPVTLGRDGITAQAWSRGALKPTLDPDAYSGTNYGMVLGWRVVNRGLTLNKIYGFEAGFSFEAFSQPDPVQVAR